MLWGFAVWALGHLVANGDLRSLILFGGFALWYAGGGDDLVLLLRSQLREQRKRQYLTARTLAVRQRFRASGSIDRLLMQRHWIVHGRLDPLCREELLQLATERGLDREQMVDATVALALGR